MTIIVGQLATSDGAAIQSVAELSPSGRGATEYRSIYTAPALEYRSDQPATILVDVDHTSEPVGEVLFLAQRGHGLFAVLDVDEDQLPAPPWYLSAELEGRRDDAGFRDITLHRVAVVERSATVAKTPAVAVTGTIDDAHLYWDNEHRPLLREASEYAKARRYRCRQPHVIARDPHADAFPAPTCVGAAFGSLELRSASTLDVTGRSRTIEVLAAPVDQEAKVRIAGRMVGETFGRGAFAGDEHRVDRIKANRDHDMQRLIGRATAIDPYSKLGCIATLKISKTLLGDETLALAEDRVLDCSVGFRVPDGGEVWAADRSRRQVVRGQLDHISLVPDPAYVGANILDVRSTR